MKKNHETFLILKTILENIQYPGRMDSHPWLESLFFQDTLSHTPSVNLTEPGRQLLLAISKNFEEMMPSMPPKQGKRLDPRWAEFGLLAALYFAPLEFGVPFPTSMREAWGHIDESIHMFVQKQAHSPLSGQQLDRYKLVSDEPTVAAPSTLSDWHRKGIQRLLGVLVTREQYLEAENKKLRSLPDTKGLGVKRVFRALRALLVVGVAVGVFFLGLKVKRIYLLTEEMRQDISLVSKLADRSSMMDSASKVGEELPKISADVRLLYNEIEPFFWITNRLSWFPKYGNDLDALQDLLTLADQTIQTTEKVYLALTPTLLLVEEKGTKPDLPNILHSLQDAQPELLEARQTIQQIFSVRADIDAQELSPEISRLLLTQFDPMLDMLDEGVAGALALPQLLGASGEGPKTYLLLVENEDELRSTGGFITAVGNIVVWNGEIVSMSFEGSGLQEDWEKPYPVAPWQLQDYMNSQVLVLRDSNWFTDFPTSALYAEYLYSYTHAHSVDGVIAFDQHMLVLLLEYLGAIEIEGAPGPVSAENVVSFMRRAKVPPPEGFQLPGDDRKEFISRIADAVLAKVLVEDNADWEGLGKIVFRALEERHLLMQFDNDSMTAILAKHGWDGSLKAKDGDFLMIVDSNIGFNKTNAIVSRSMVYDVDLTDLDSPQSSLFVTHTNHGSEDVPCIHWDGEREIEDNRSYPIDRCYWNYLRVYVKEGGKLITATPHQIPGEWMILERSIPARVDVLDEVMNGVQGYGTLLVVPGAESVSTSFDFSLPKSVISNPPAGDDLSYHLTLKKQPGTLIMLATIRVHLPSTAVIESVSQQAVVEGTNILVETDLVTDMELVIVFRYSENPN